MDPLTVAKLWMLVKPIKRIRLANKRRKARKAGLPEPQVLDDQGENEVFAKGKMTKSGVVISMLGPIIGIGLTAAGVGECAPEDVAAGCQSAEEISQALILGISSLITAVGGVISWKGRNRVGK